MLSVQLMLLLSFVILFFISWQKEEQQPTSVFKSTEAWSAACK
jgi:hypothetical protein